MKIVFDFGAVLFRWEPQAFFPRRLPQLARDEPSTARLLKDFFQGYGGDWGEFDRGTVGPDELIGRIAARTGLADRDVRAIVECVPSELQLLPHTEPLLARLRARGHPLFYLSNMPAPYADHLERSHPLADWFIAGVFSSRHRLVKPEPAIFRLAERTFGASAGELLFIDDSPVNVEAARACGWDAIHFQSAPQCEADLAARGLL